MSISDEERKNRIEQNRSYLKVSVKQLNTAVQRTIDRIIFLRMCEDRSMEKYGQLRSIAEKDNIYKNLCHVYTDADEKYNSGLFHFKKEKDREALPDEFTLRLVIDDSVLKSIFRRLYYPNSPYEFSVISTEILGNIYEQFLGKIIRLTEGHRAKIEEKPEIKRAGGVYYTPQYIVDYIVKNSVGPFCKGKTPKQLSDFKILDPACGSGSFLLGAYSYLLQYHLDYYISRKNPSRYKDQIYQIKEGEWALTIKEKKGILLNNIYGVDIDTQAVEVTKLSLLLKVLEGERRDIFEKQQKLFKERALPDLENNIKCGNSIAGPDFFENNIQTSLPDEGELYRINAFDWQREFSDIMNSGGFDVIIGNPPYVDIKTLPNADVRYIFNTFKSANNRINLFAVFVERSLTLVKEDSFRFSMIIPTAILTQESYKELRQQILNKFQIDSVARIPNESFGSSAGDVKVDTVILVIRNKGSRISSVQVLGYKGYDRIYKIDPSTAHIKRRINQSFWNKSKDNVWSINTTEKDEQILKKCEINSINLEECVDFSLGITPYDKYKGHTQEQIKNRVFHADFKKNDTYKKLLAGNDVTRYSVKWNSEEWISYGPWLGAPREQRFFTEKRILVKQIIDWTTKRIWATIADNELYNTQNAFNLLPKGEWNLEFILGILNSKLMTYCHKKRFLDEFKMRFQKILIKDCKRFPIYRIDMAIKSEKAIHDKIVYNVNLMLDLNKKYNQTKASNEKIILERRIDAIDDQIDKLVYELYGLTKEEISIVEESLKV